MKVSIYDTENGRILRHLTLSSADDLAHNLRAGEAHLPGHVDPQKYEVRDGKKARRKGAAAAAAEAATRARSAELRRACRSAIESGFFSAALGARHLYGNTMADQLNRLMAVAGGVGAALWCADEAGSWRRRTHSTEALRQLCADASAWGEACLDHHAGLGAALGRAKTVKAAEAVAWTLQKDKSQ